MSYVMVLLSKHAVKSQRMAASITSRFRCAEQIYCSCYFATGGWRFSRVWVRWKCIVWHVL